MRLLSTLLISLFMITASSCQKGDKESDPKPQPPTTDPKGRPALTQAELACRVTKNSFIRQSTSGTTTTEYTYEYDAKGRRSKITGSDGSITTYEYNDLNQVVKITNDYPANSSSLDQTMANEFDGQGRWLKGTFNNVNGTSYYVVNRDGEGNRSRIDIVYPPTSQVTASHSYTYSGGNLSKYVFRGADTDSTVTTYEYFLDKENKYKPVAESMAYTYGYQTASKNLIRREITTHYGFGSNNGLASPPNEISYEFNDKGYITKATLVNTGTGNKLIYSNPKWVV